MGGRVCLSRNGFDPEIGAVFQIFADLTQAGACEMLASHTRDTSEAEVADVVEQGEDALVGMAFEVLNIFPRLKPGDFPGR